MIKIDKNVFLNDAKIPQSYKDALKKYGIPKLKDGIKEAVYHAAKPRLIEIFNDKCAFCELKGGIDKDAAYDVEHFRPKREVTEDKNHNGYFWLAHEWTNFLLSCQTCNRSYKRNYFPISGKRISSILPIDTVKIDAYDIEIPLLLNPVFDDNIEEHLVFHRNGYAKGKTKKGKKSVTYYGLNRTGLLQIRKRILFSIQNQILFLYKKGRLPNEEKMKETIERIIEVKILEKIENPQTSLIAFRTAILKNFIDFIIRKKIYIDNDEPIEIPQQDLWIKYAKEVLEGYSNFTP